MPAILKQPLFHFLLAGVLIFVFYAVTAPEIVESEQPDNVITVDRNTLLNFMQYRAQAFRPDVFSEQLDSMSEAEVATLVEAYVREEALHREALAMGMDQGDYIIRQRLVQKVEFLLENMVNQALVPEEEDVVAYYEAHRDEYRIDAVYTFTHIFFDGEERGWDQARADALTLLDSAQISSVAFNDASQFGDRYPFLQNYVDRTRDFVVNNFNEGFTAALDALAPSESRWYGPFESRYGWHLVMLRERREPSVPPVDSIRDRVLDDWRYDTVLANRREAEAQVIDTYDVQVNLGGD